MFGMKGVDVVFDCQIYKGHSLNSKIYLNGRLGRRLAWLLVEPVATCRRRSFKIDIAVFVAVLF